MTAWMPERFCSLEVLSAGGDVTLDGLTEASVCIDTAGGSLSAGKVKATSADITTAGGELTGSITAGGAVATAA